MASPISRKFCTRRVEQGPEVKDHNVDDDKGNKDKWHRNDKFLSIFDLFNFVATFLLH